VVVAWLVDVRSGVVEVVRVTPFVAQRCFTLFHLHALSRLQALSTNISGHDFTIAPVVVVAWLVDVRSGVVEVVRVTPFVAQRCFTLFHRHALSRLQTLSTNISGHVNSSLF
jgi:ABC-type amino acid transport system permease subunit